MKKIVVHFPIQLTKFQFDVLNQLSRAEAIGGCSIRAIYNNEPEMMGIRDLHLKGLIHHVNGVSTTITEFGEHTLKQLSV